MGGVAAVDHSGDTEEVTTGGSTTTSVSSTSSTATSTSTPGTSGTPENEVLPLAHDADLDGDGYLDEAEFATFMNSLLQLELSQEDLLLLMLLFGVPDPENPGKLKVHINNNVRRMVTQGVIFSDGLTVNKTPGGQVHSFNLDLSKITAENLTYAFWNALAIVYGVDPTTVDSLSEEQFYIVLVFMFPDMRHGWIPAFILNTFGDGRRISREGISLFFEAQPFVFSGTGFVSSTGTLDTSGYVNPEGRLISSVWNYDVIFNTPILLNNYLNNHYFTNNDGVEGELTLQELTVMFPGLDEDTLTLILMVFGTTNADGELVLDLEGIQALTTEGVLSYDASTGLFSFDGTKLSAVTIFWAIINFIADVRGVDPSEVDNITQLEFFTALTAIFGPAAASISFSIIQQLFITFGHENAGDDDINYHSLTAAELFSMISSGAIRPAPMMNGFTLTFDLNVTPPPPPSTSESDDDRSDEEIVDDAISYVFIDERSPADPVDGEEGTSEADSEVVEYPVPGGDVSVDVESSTLVIPASPSGDGTSDIVLTDAPVFVEVPSESSAYTEPTTKNITDERNMTRTVQADGTVVWKITNSDGRTVTIHAEAGSELDVYLSDYRSYIADIRAGVDPMLANSEVAYTTTDAQGNTYTVYKPKKNQFGAPEDVARGSFMTFNGEIVVVESVIYGTDDQGNAVIIYEFKDKNGRKGHLAIKFDSFDPEVQKPFMNLLFQADTVVDFDSLDGVEIDASIQGLVQSFVNYIVNGDVDEDVPIFDDGVIRSDAVLDAVTEGDEEIAADAAENGIAVSGRVMVAIGAAEEGEVDPDGLYFIARTDRNIAILRHHGILGPNEEYDHTLGYDLPADYTAPDPDADTSHIPPLSNAGRQMLDAEGPDGAEPEEDDPEDSGAEAGPILDGGLVIDPFTTSHGSQQLLKLPDESQLWVRNIIVGTEMTPFTGPARPRVTIRNSDGWIPRLNALGGITIAKQLMWVTTVGKMKRIAEFQISGGFRVGGETESGSINSWKGVASSPVSISVGYRFRFETKRSRNRTLTLRGEDSISSLNNNGGGIYTLSNFISWLFTSMLSTGTGSTPNREASHNSIFTSLDLRARVVFSFNPSTRRWEAKVVLDVFTRHSTFLSGTIHEHDIPFFRSFGMSRGSRTGPTSHTTNNRSYNLGNGLNGGLPSFLLALIELSTWVGNTQSGGNAQRTLGFLVSFLVFVFGMIMSPAVNPLPLTSHGGGGAGGGGGGGGGGGVAGEETDIPPHFLSGAPPWVQQIFGVNNPLLPQAPVPAALPSHGNLSPYDSQSITIDHYFVPPQAGIQSSTTVANEGGSVTILSHTVGGTTYYYRQAADGSWEQINNSLRKQIIKDATANGWNQETMTFKPGDGTSPGVLTIVNANGDVMTVVGNFPPVAGQTQNYQIYINGEQIASITITLGLAGQLTITATMIVDGVEMEPVVLVDTNVLLPEPMVNMLQDIYGLSDNPDTQTVNNVAVPGSEDLAHQQVITVVGVNGEMINVPVLITPNGDGTYTVTVYMPNGTIREVVIRPGQPARLVVDGVVIMVDINNQGQILVTSTSGQAQDINANNPQPLIYDNGQISGTIMSVFIDPETGIHMGNVQTENGVVVVPLEVEVAAAPGHPHPYAFQNVYIMVNGRKVRVRLIEQAPDGSGRIQITYRDTNGEYIIKTIGITYTIPSVQPPQNQQQDEVIPIYSLPSNGTIQFNNEQVSGEVVGVEVDDEGNVILHVKKDDGTIETVQSEFVDGQVQGVTININGDSFNVNMIDVNENGTGATFYTDELPHRNGQFAGYMFSNQTIPTLDNNLYYSGPSDAENPNGPQINGVITDIVVTADGAHVATVIDGQGRTHQVKLKSGRSEEADYNAYGNGSVTIGRNGRRVTVSGVRLNDVGHIVVSSAGEEEGVPVETSGNIRLVITGEDNSQNAYYGFDNFMIYNEDGSTTYIEPDSNAVVTVSNPPETHTVSQSVIFDPTTNTTYEITHYANGQVEVAVYTRDADGNVTRQSVYTEDGNQGLIITDGNGNRIIDVTRNGDGIVIEANIGGKRFTVTPRGDANGSFSVDTTPPLVAPPDDGQGDPLVVEHEEVQAEAEDLPADEVPNVGNAINLGDDGDAGAGEAAGDGDAEVAVQVGPQGSITVNMDSGKGHREQKKPQPQPVFKFTLVTARDGQGRPVQVTYRWHEFAARFPVAFYAEGGFQSREREPGFDERW